MKEKLACSRCISSGAECQTTTTRKSCDRCTKQKVSCSLVKAPPSHQTSLQLFGRSGVTQAEVSTSSQQHGRNVEREIGGSANDRSATEWETLMKERKAKQRATEEVSQLRYELNTLRRNIDARYVKKEIHERQTAQLQGRIQKLEEDLLTEERNTLSLQLRIDGEVDKLEDILYLKESDGRVQQLVKESHNGLKKIVREIKAARPSDSQVMKNILSITKRGFQQDEGGGEDDGDVIRVNKHQRIE
ncbi:hypothetical protein K443DRAFT_197186 [Laccaria amethystina LaAM-08-1]|uniref:Zn(2)-C6 fungal-type domain-containing protein n=1 Tax=Laccaria amethystina LaAM-08-1 TaxID=1095629 RepID=A0A0C9XMC8_9AGAR|nr:hypothetical protein K443DRAFT_197186 [Laccaria amethystina LaAM-08-1]